MAVAVPGLVLVNSPLPWEAHRLVIADDMTLIREALAALCSVSRYRVVGQCADGFSALSLIQDLKPDLALLDGNLPGLHTMEILRQVKAAGLPTRIAVLSVRSDRKTVLEALKAGAGAFVLKSGPSSHLLDAMAQMLQGGVYLSPLLAINEIFFARDTAPSDPFDGLSPREFQVFGLLIEGLRPKEIGARLGLSPKTIDTYRSSLMRKLDIHDVAGLVRYAMQRHFIPGS